MENTQQIDSSQITFIIQGPENYAVKQSVSNIRTLLPNAKIILSSTARYREDVSGVDNVIVSEDPGALPYTSKKGSRPNNTNRQIVTTLAGLRLVTTKFVFKLRSDFIFQSDCFLQFFNQYPLHQKGYKIFERKVLACSYFSRNPRSHHPYPFHISDLIFFGLTEDILNLYDIPLMTDIDYRFIKSGDEIVCRYHPEQHILLNCLKKNKFAYHCTHFNFVTEKNTTETERIFTSNFVILSFKQLGVLPTKATFEVKNDPGNFSSCYTPLEWIALYKQNCDPTIRVGESDQERIFINQCMLRYKVFKLFSRLITFPIFWPKQRRIVYKRVLNLLIKV